MFVHEHTGLKLWLSREVRFCVKNLGVIWLLVMKDIKAKYATTYLGPIWNAINYAVFILIIGVVYTKLWGTSLDIFLPFFAVSFLCWSFISSCLLESSAYYKSGEVFLIGAARYSSLSELLRILLRNILMQLHNIPFLVLIMYLYPSLEVPGISHVLSCLLGFLVLFLLMTFISGLSSWFKDFTQILPLILQLFFFATPIFWYPSLLEGRGLALDVLLTYNPIYNLLIFFRGPFLAEGLGDIFSPYYPLSIMLGAAGLYMQYKRARLNF
jgi:ABC-type polysaccharide/polyol phosphate export permease